MESESIGKNTEYNTYVTHTRMKWVGVVAATVAASALTIASLAAVFIAAYALINMAGSSYAFYHSVKVIVLGSLGAGLGVVFISKLVRYATGVYRELQESSDVANVQKILLARQEQSKKERDEIDAIRGKSDGKLKDLEVNLTANKILEDVEKGMYDGWELTLLGSVVVVTAVVLMALGLNSLAAGGVITHDLTWMWLGCGAGGIIGGGLLDYGVHQIKSSREMAKAVEDLTVEDHRTVVADYLDLHFDNSRSSS